MARSKPMYRVFSLTRIGAFAIESFYPYPHKRYGMPVYSIEKADEFRRHARTRNAYEYDDFEIRMTR